MTRVFYLHWHETEALGTVRAIRDAGYEVFHHADDTRTARIEPLPDVCVISLARLPSHGRAVAEWFRESKQRRTIPLVFVGGEPDRVAATRAKFPDVLYCKPEELLDVIESAARHAPAATGARRRPPAGRNAPANRRSMPRAAARNPKSKIQNPKSPASATEGRVSARNP